MRKFPIYSFLQEMNMQLMMVLLIIAYISYDFMDLLNIFSYLIIGVSVIAIAFLFKKQMSSMKVAKIIAQTTSKSAFSVRKNWMTVLTVNFIIILFSGLHFYLYQQQGRAYDPLISEYGFGAILGVSIFIFNYLKAVMIVTDQGVVVGSKFSPNLVCWEDIDQATRIGNKITIVPKSTFGIKEISIQNIPAQEALITMLRIHNKLK